MIFSKTQYVGEDQICTSIIIACESRFGARKKNFQKLIEKLGIILDSIEILPLVHPVEQFLTLTYLVFSIGGLKIPNFYDKMINPGRLTLTDGRNFQQ